MSPTQQLSTRPPVVAQTPMVSAPTESRAYRQLFDREALAEYLRLSTDTIDRRVKPTKPHCVRIGHQVRFTPDPAGTRELGLRAFTRPSVRRPGNCCARGVA